MDVIEYYAKDGSLREIGALVIDLHAAGYHCSETLIRALWPYLLPDYRLDETILRMTSTLHGGMAETMSSHCGGLTIGILLIGALYGRTDMSGDARYDSAIARGFWQRFLNEFGTSHCTSLKQGEPTGEASSRCTCIMVRSARMFLNYLDELQKNPVDREELYYWRVDRTKELCHEQIQPLKPAEEIKAELRKKQMEQKNLNA
jgi:C_GCAxxG_C_C family probable redox protein